MEAFVAKRLVEVLLVDEELVEARRVAVALVIDALVVKRF
jgi:hypothetical protein